jgi:hypothetical protein
VVVEDDLLHSRVERHRLELAQTARIRSLDDDQAADGVELETRRVHDLELVRIEPAQLPDVSVE